MAIQNAPASSGFIPLYALYGEEMLFPDVLHCEMISDRASLRDWKIAPHRHQNLHQFFLILRGQTIANMDGEIVNPVQRAQPNSVFISVCRRHGRLRSDCADT